MLYQVGDDRPQSVNELLDSLGPAGPRKTNHQDWRTQKPERLEWPERTGLILARVLWVIYSLAIGIAVVGLVISIFD